MYHYLRMCFLTIWFYDSYNFRLKDYEMANWESLASHYADTAKIFFNATQKNPKTVAQMIEQDKNDVILFTSYNFVPEEFEFEMVETDKGETWVNYWAIWIGKMKSNGKEYKIPFHNTVRFIDGKIVREYGYWDNSEIVTDMLTNPQTPAPTTETATEGTTTTEK